MWITYHTTACIKAVKHIVRCKAGQKVIVQAFYEKKAVNLKQIAIQGFFRDMSSITEKNPKGSSQAKVVKITIV